MTPTEKAQQLLDAVRAGQTVFTKAACWMIVGPTAIITPGARITVTKRDGSTSEVIVAAINNTKSAQGVDYTVATFTEVPAARPAAKPRTGYTEVTSTAYGRGRRYHAQPGATQYADGFGGHSTQIWDES